jgi:outer membrane protein OmpA-like peptidoglycan-associated protein
MARRRRAAVAEAENMMLKTPLLIAGAGLFALTACVDPNQYPDDPNARAKGGALTGALIGGVIGASGDGDNRLAKTVIGAGIGAAIGGAIGSSLDQQAADLRNSIGNPNITVTNNGQFLVVNMPQDLLFAVDSAALRPDLTRDIKAVAASLLRYPNSQIEVVGHTDNSGSAAYNQDLSQRRAVSVANVLRESGVPNGRIVAYGRGEDQPVASNLTPAGMAQNRRVEIIIRPNGV